MADSVWLLKGWHSFREMSSLIPGQKSLNTWGVISLMRRFHSRRMRLTAFGSQICRDLGVEPLGLRLMFWGYSALL